MSKAIFRIVICVFVSFPLLAQDSLVKQPKTDPKLEANREKAQERATKMIKRYGFPQMLWVKIVDLKYARLNAVESAKSSKPVNHEAIIDANRDYRNGLKALLTPQQFSMVQKDWNLKLEKHDKGRHKDEFYDMYEDD